MKNRCLALLLSTLLLAGCAPSGPAASGAFIRESPAMVIIRSASIWMLASTVLADCRAIG